MGRDAMGGGVAAQHPGVDAAMPAATLADALLAQHAVAVAELDLAAQRVRRLSPALAALLGGGADSAAARQLLLLCGPQATRLGAAATVQLRCADEHFVPVHIARLDTGPAQVLLLVSVTAADAAAADAAERYRDIYDNVTEGIYRASIDGRQLAANPALVRLNGYTTEAEMLAAIADIAKEWYVDPQRRAEFVCQMQAHGRVDNFVSEVYRHRTRERIWVSENARVVRDRSTGAPLYFEGSIRDVTETVRRLQVEERLRTVVATIADGVLTTDAAQLIRSANPAAVRMFGWSGEAALLGQPIACLLADAPPADTGAERRLLGRRHDGGLLVLDVTVAEAVEHGGPMHIYVLRDATERLRRESGLHEAKEAAERANRAKSDFLAVMSHELRTPLNAVIGMTGLLLEGALEAPARRQAETLRHAADHLLMLINDVLDFSKLDAGRVEMEQLPFDLDSVVNGVLDLLAARAHAKGLEVCAYVPPSLPMLLGDAGRLGQVLINLVGNAIKFTEQGAVSIEVSRTAGAGAVALTFEVRDSGIGIAAQHLPLLFQAFSQADSSVTRRFGGTGLGLAICARLVAGMGGTIGVASTPGQGSTFTFTVRLAEAAGSRPAALRLDGVRVLVVDDNAVNRSIFVRQITARGGAAEAVADPAAALAVLRGDAGYDAVLIDQAMPQTDGLALAQRLRGEPRLATLRLVLAASSAVGAPAPAAASLFDMVLSKPVPVDGLVRALRGAGGRRRGVVRVGGPADQARHGRALRLLVAEDNAINQVVIRAMIERLGHVVEMVGNGSAAVAAVRSGAEYDAVLMDVMMPELDGIEATRLIRALPAPRGRVPVFGLTAHVGAEEHAMFRAAGMDAVLAKPIGAKALAAALAPLTQQVAA